MKQVLLALLMTVAVYGEERVSASGETLYAYEAYMQSPQITSMETFVFDHVLTNAGTGEEMAPRFKLDNSRIESVIPVYRITIAADYQLTEDSAKGVREGVRRKTIGMEYHYNPVGEPTAACVIHTETVECDKVGETEVCASFLPEPDLSRAAILAEWVRLDAIYAAKKDSVSRVNIERDTPVVFPDL